MGKIPKKILKWRKQQPPGRFMKPETAKAIEAKAAKSGKIRDPGAVIGSIYWPKVKEEFHKTHHSPAKPL